jgi:hypothetical protein
VQLLQRLFLRVAGPAAMAAAASVKATQQVSDTHAASTDGMYRLSGWRARTHTGPSGVAVAPFVRFDCTAPQVAAAVETAEAAATAAWEEVAAARAEAAAGYCPPSAGSDKRKAEVEATTRVELMGRTLPAGALAARAASLGRSLSEGVGLAVGLSTAVGTTLRGARATTEQAAALLASTAGVTSLQRKLLDFSRRYLPGLEEEREEQQRKRTERTRQARRRLNATLRECGAAMGRAEAAQAMAIRRLSLRLSLLRSDSWRTRTYDEGIWPTSWSELETHA